MKRIFLVMALAFMLVAATALSGVALAGGSPTSKCQQQEAAAGFAMFCGFGDNNFRATLDFGAGP
jgi:hypothetical protein